jgi:hypothetical protein
MRPRAAPKLAALRPPRLLDALAEGMGLVAEHVFALERSAQQQEGLESRRAVEAIRVVSEEEAGKFLILLDVARAAHADAAVKARQLRRTWEHIAKGIYSRAADIRPADFAEIVSFVGGLRRSHYLDGPNDVDWIFRNEIETAREERLYVDYVASDDGDMWISPQRFEDYGPSYPSGGVELVGALTRAGFCTATVLAEVGDIWRNFHPGPKTHWQENLELTRATLERVPNEVVHDDLTDGDIGRILESWTFPLYELELGKIKVDLEELRGKQRDWDPDGLTLEDYL